MEDFKKLKRNIGLLYSLGYILKMYWTFSSVEIYSSWNLKLFIFEELFYKKLWQKRGTE